MNSTVYELLREGSKLDWISPLWGLVQVVIKGNGCAFTFPVGPRSGQEIVSILHWHGIETYAHGFDPWTETIQFRVSKKDANKASEILRRSF